MHAYQKDVLLYFLLTRHKMYGGAAKPKEGGFQQEEDEMFTALPAASWRFFVSWWFIVVLSSFLRPPGFNVCPVTKCYVYEWKWREACPWAGIPVSGFYQAKNKCSLACWWAYYLLECRLEAVHYAHLQELCVDTVPIRIVHFFPELGLSDWQERRKSSDAHADVIAFLCVGLSVISFISMRNILISCNSMSWWKSDKLVIVLRVHECVQDLTRAEYPLLNWIHSNTTKRKALWKCWLSITLHGGMLSSGSQGDLTMRSFYIRRATYILLNIHVLLIAACAWDTIYNCNVQGPILIPRDRRVQAHGVADVHFKHCMYGASERVQCTITHTAIMMQGPLCSFRLNTKKICIIRLHMETENLCQRMPINVWGDSIAWGPPEETLALDLICDHNSWITCYITSLAWNCTCTPCVVMNTMSRTHVRRSTWASGVL